MKNVNRFLESAWRSDLFGFNMASGGMIYKRGREYPEERRGGTTPSAQWDEPRPGMQGSLCLGHHVDCEDALRIELTVDGKACGLYCVRNRWTPAWMETFYRSEIDSAYYPHSGTLVLKEKKAILREDVLISHLTLTNEKREASRVELALVMPFGEGDEGIYTVDVGTVPRALGKVYRVKGCAVLTSDRGGRRLVLEIPAFGSAEIRYAMAFSPEGEAAARRAVTAALGKEDPFGENETAFNRWFAENVPLLESEDTDLLKVYYYRWYVVYRSIHQPSAWIEGHPIPGLCMYESPFGDWFGTVIGLPVAWQVSDAKWMRSREVMQNQVKNWSEGRDGYRGYIQFTPWAAWQCYQVSRDREWLSSVYAGFAEYGRGILAGSRPPLTVGSWVTGAEYQPAFYQYTEEPWDWRYDSEGMKVGFHQTAIYRADAISYLILSLRGCAEMARELGESGDAAEFSGAADELAVFIREKLWDAEKSFFYGFDPAVGKRCDEAACYDGFAPYMEGIVGREYFGGLAKLWDKGWFASEYGATTAARSCPMFWYDNCIAGPTASSVKEPHEYGCCWNGTVWPYANSIISAGLGAAAVEEASLRERWLDFFAAYTNLHFVYGDRSTPVVCEHYRCDDGACFSLYYEYFHSSYIDQFMRFYAGIRIEGDEVRFEPFAKEAFALRGVRIGERVFDFVHDADGRCEVIITE